MGSEDIFSRILLLPEKCENTSPGLSKLTLLRNGVRFSEMMLFSLIYIQLPGIWTELENVTDITDISV